MNDFGPARRSFEPNRTGPEVEHIELRMPAEPALWPIARQLINVIAARAHFPSATVDDLCIAVSELCTMCAADLDRRSTIALSVDLNPEQIEVECRASTDPSGEVDLTPLRIADQYLERILV